MSETIETMRKISDWIVKYGWNVKWNQKNTDGFDTFHSNDNSKPDLLIQKNGYNVLIECKPCKKHNDILDGVDQLIKYAGLYYTGRHIYTDKKPGEPIPIHGFVLSTNYSKHGYLYQEEDEHGYVTSTYLSQNKNLIERPITHSVTRMLWRQWEKGLASEHYRELRDGEASASTVLPSKPKIGTLLAKIRKDTRQISEEPHFFLNSNEFTPAGYDNLYVFN